jgi:predicted RNA-binding protein YlxR (DUF448 family)
MLAHAHNEELDTGPRKGKAGAERFCAVTRTVRPAEELIRFVVGPDGVVPDLKRNLPGRGLWVTAGRAALKEAVARNVFAKGFKRDVRVNENLVGQTERLLARSVLDALAMAGKSGLVAAGFAKVEAALTHDHVVGLLHASDGSADGISKLAGVLRRRDDAERVKVINAFSSAELDLALGRSNVVHAALLAGPANDTFLARLMRLERFRTGEPGQAAKATNGTDRT